MGLSRQEYWSELPCSPPGDLEDLGFEPVSPALQVDSLPEEPSGLGTDPGMLFPWPGVGAFEGREAVSWRTP